MPIEDKKQKNDPMVDVGEKEGADIQLENKSSIDNESVETKQEDTKPLATEKVEASDKQQEANTEKKEENSKELDDYSDGVQRRIAKLTKKMREAERQKDEAIRYAQIVKQQKDLTEKKYSSLEIASVKEREDKIKSALEAAKARLSLAREAGDISAEVDVSKEIARLGYEDARLQEFKSTADSMPRELPQQQVFSQPQKQSIVPQNIPTDERAESWASKNRWFGTDKAMTYTAFDIHRQIVDEEGYDPKSEEYYAEIDKRIRLEFPHKFDTNNNTETTRPVQTVASGKRSTKIGRQTVRLTPSQVAIAKKLGVPLEEYAKQLNITKEV